MKISIVINADTRQGAAADCSTTGDFGQGSLHGVRSLDFLTDGVLMVSRFFSGHQHEIILSIDERDPLPRTTRNELNALVIAGALKRWECSPKDHSRLRWNDYLYMDSLRLAPRKATHVVHLDQDTAIFREPNCDIVERWLKWLDTGEYSYICQPFNGGDLMLHASTRFFICRRETLQNSEIARRINAGEGPCLEHVLGRIAGVSVLYPPAENEQYLIISWARYYKGLLRKLCAMPFSEVTALIQKWGILGANDVLAQPVP